MCHCVCDRAALTSLYLPPHACLLEEILLQLLVFCIVDTVECLANLGNHGFSPHHKRTKTQTQSPTCSLYSVNSPGIPSKALWPSSLLCICVGCSTEHYPRLSYIFNTEKGAWRELVCAIEGRARRDMARACERRRWAPEQQLLVWCVPVARKQGEQPGLRCRKAQD